MGALQSGINISLSDLSLPMLMDVIEFNAKLTGGDKENKKVKSLTEIAKGGKI